MAQQKIITGNAYKPYIGKVFAAGAISDTVKWADLSLRNSALNATTQTTTIAQTSTVGGQKAVSSGTFLYQAKNKYVIRGVSETINGVTSSIVRIVGSDYNRVSWSPSFGNHRYDVTSWSRTTGLPTKGGSAGAAVNFHNISANDDNLLVEAQSNHVPGEFVYRNGSAVPVQADYPVRTVA